MQTVYVGNTLINDVMLGSQRMDDVLQNTAIYVDWLLVGGGGAGGSGASGRAGGGGGAGRFVSSSIILPNLQSSYSITVGNGGSGVASGRGDSGGNSTITLLNNITYIAPGGGGGGLAGGTTTTGAGRAGGSGGGAGANSSARNAGSAIAGNPIAGFGFQGGNTTGNSVNYGEGGGGAAQTFPSFGIGTPGVAWLNGVTYAAGGNGEGGGNSYSENTGGGGNGSTGTGGNGRNGICIIRYLGTPKASGGTITQSGGYTYHTFTTSGTFVY